MPYYVYRIGPFGQLHKLDEFASFKAASALAKSLRAATDAPSQTRVKMIFAADEQLAEDLLCQVREVPPPGDE
jgi:hypothetical protein